MNHSQILCLIFAGLFLLEIGALKNGQDDLIVGKFFLYVALTGLGIWGAFG